MRDQALNAENFTCNFFSTKKSPATHLPTHPTPRLMRKKRVLPELWYTVHTYSISTSGHPPENPLKHGVELQKMEMYMIDQELPGKLEIRIISRPSSQAQRIWRKRGRRRDLRPEGFQHIDAHPIAVRLITPIAQ